MLDDLRLQPYGAASVSSRIEAAYRTGCSGGASIVVYYSTSSSAIDGPISIGFVGKVDCVSSTVSNSAGARRMAAHGVSTSHGAADSASVVPFVDLAAQHQVLRHELEAAFQDTLTRGDFILGGAVGAFEAEFAAYVGVEHAVGTASGLDALTLTLHALGIGPGHEVITVANTFFATALAIYRTGARPVLVDCESQTLAMDVDQVADAVTPRTRALLPVHLYGRMADVASLQQIADRFGLAVVEDAAQAHGAALDGKSAGGCGAAGCFSFYPSKNLGALGDGGAVTTQNAGLAERLRMLRNYGSQNKYDHVEVGFNSRLDTMQAAVLRVKLPHLDEWNHRRRLAAAYYRKRLADLPLDLRCAPRDADFPTDHVSHLFPIEVDDRDEVKRRLGEMGIQTGVHYPVPVHLSQALAPLGYQRGDFPVAERSADRLLSLPIFPEISDEQLERTCAALEQILLSR
jgi:dTDP-4-amino-4,6-dideoxygalactose transaminase